MENFDWKFETFKDKILIDLLDEVKTWLRKKDKSILTMSGPTEVGKSHILRKSYELCRDSEIVYNKKKFNYPNEIYITWSEFVSKNLKTNGDLLDTCSYCGFLFIEDFLKNTFTFENKFNVVALEFAYDILNARVGKPTMLDTNKSIREIELLDQRVASRLMREGGVFIDIPSETKKYLKRKK